MLVERFGFSLRHSYWSLLTLAACLFLLQMPLFFKVLRSAPEPKVNGGPSLNLKSKWVVLKFSFLYLLQGLAVGSFIGLFPFYVNKKFGVQSGALGALYFVSMFVQAAVSAIAPQIAKRLGAPKTMALALASTVPFWFLFPLAPGFVWVALIYVMRLGFASLCNPLLPSLFFRLIYEDEKATANSIISMVSTGSNVLAPKVGGHLMQNVNIDIPPVMGGCLYVVYAASVYLLLRNEKGNGVIADGIPAR